MQTVGGITVTYNNQSITVHLWEKSRSITFCVIYQLFDAWDCGFVYYAKSDYTIRESLQTEENNYSHSRMQKHC